MQLERVGPYLWRIPRDEGRGMRVPGLIVADEHLIASIRSDASLEQLANGATLPGIVRAALAMPDIHQGYGLPVGGVVATDAEHGVISPGAIGFDINCGVRLLKTPLDAGDVERGLQEPRSEEHTSELQSRLHLVCRLLLEKKKKKNTTHRDRTKKRPQDETVCTYR